MEGRKISALQKKGKIMIEKVFITQKEGFNSADFGEPGAWDPALLAQAKVGSWLGKSLVYVIGGDMVLRTRLGKLESNLALGYGDLGHKPYLGRGKLALAIDTYDTLAEDYAVMLAKERIHTCIFDSNSGILTANADVTPIQDFVGKDVEVNVDPLIEALEDKHKTIPIIAPIANTRKGHYSPYSQLVLDADLVSVAIAKALLEKGKEVILIKPGSSMIDDQYGFVRELTYAEYMKKRGEGKIRSGMESGLDTAFAAVASGAEFYITDDFFYRSVEGLISPLIGVNYATKLVKGDYE